jgi:hypothetical protein
LELENDYFTTLSGIRFFAEPVLSDMRSFALLRMTRSEGLRMTVGARLRVRMTGGIDKQHGRRGIEAKDKR